MEFAANTRLIYNIFEGLQHMWMFMVRVKLADYKIHVAKLSSIFCIFGKEITPTPDVQVPQPDSNTALRQMLRCHSDKALHRSLKYMFISGITPHKMIQPLHFEDCSSSVSLAQVWLHCLKNKILFIHLVLESLAITTKESRN